MSLQNSIRVPGSLMLRAQMGGMMPYQGGGVVGQPMPGLQRVGGRAITAGDLPFRPTGAGSPAAPGGAGGGQPGGMLGNIQQQYGQFGQFLSPMQGVAGQLQGFNPFGGALGGAAQGSLSGLLQSGAPVDVSPITQAAQGAAGRTFQDLMGQTNERFGALGLGSSSARTAALARGAQNLAAQVGEEGLRAGVGAQEAARQRQLGAFSPFLGATGQQQSALGQAGNIFGNVAQLQQGNIQGQQGLFGNLLGQQGQQINQVPQGTPTPRPEFIAPPGFGGFAGGFQGGGAVEGGVLPGGGRMDFGDYLSDILFGQRFNRAVPQQEFIVAPQAPAPRALAQIGDSGGGLGAQQARFTPPPQQQQFPAYLQRQAPKARQPMSFQDFVRSLNPGFLTAGPGGFSPISPGMDPLAANFNAGLVNLGGAPGAAQAYNAYLGGFRGQTGGVIPGPAVPPDTVPVLAQGGEVILPVDVVHELRESSSKDPLIRKIKKISQRTPKADGAQAGGGFPTAGGNEFLQQLASQLGQTPAFGNQPGVMELGSPGTQGLSRGTLSVLGAEPNEERDLQDAVRFASARLKNLEALAMKSPQGSRMRELVAAAKEELEGTKKGLQNRQLLNVEEAKAQAELAQAAARGQVGGLTQRNALEKEIRGVIDDEMKAVGQGTATQEQALMNAANRLAAQGLPVPQELLPQQPSQQLGVPPQSAQPQPPAQGIVPGVDPAMQPAIQISQELNSLLDAQRAGQQVDHVYVGQLMAKLIGMGVITREQAVQMAQLYFSPRERQERAAEEAQQAELQRQQIREMSALRGIQ